MDRLQCDICGGSLVMQEGGESVICESCGMKYSSARMREKIQEIKGVVKVEGAVSVRQTGTEEDIVQWHELIKKYCSAGDYDLAVKIVNKVLEACPTDVEANYYYDMIRWWRNTDDIDYRDRILYGYSGQASNLFVSGEDVEKIWNNAFRNCHTLKTITIGEGVSSIGAGAFSNCEALQEIIIPASVTRIGMEAFVGCRMLRNVSIPDEMVSPQIFEDWNTREAASPWYREYIREKTVTEYK